MSVLESRERAVPMVEADVPLVVDLDGTLLKTDLLYEALFVLLATHPLTALRTPLWLREGKAAFKARLADAVLLDLRTLPVNEAVLDLIQEAKAAGRRVYLASASDRRYVQAFADHMGGFDGVYASDGVTNLGAGNKARSLVALFGEGGFDYVGNSMADVPVWQVARTAYAVNASGAVVRAARAASADVRVLEGRTAGVGDYLRAMRLHQWAKNLLILVPGLAAHTFSAGALWHALLAFLSFSLCASSVYLLNDLLDLRSDRQHASKRLRPFAAGTVPLSHGMALFPVLLVASVAAALLLSPAFVAVLAGYYGLTLAYSLALKRHLIIDVVTLSSLYGVRLVAGGVAFGVALSEWLIAFSTFFFLSLALVKRVTELIGRRRAGKGDPAGRAYTLDDLPVLEMLAASSGFVSVLVLALYINSPEVMMLYRHPQLLWCGGLVLIYWLCRIMVLTHRGQMNDDPVIYAVTDRVSLSCGVLLILALAGATL
ncbi:4-hydroxybenzoate polyprenyltransferase/phosphoserine phosphatase [Azospirillum fermentarium]|uniref:UbiA family prenyltransferase n=1 Tax=Azospirillum fermentarium TaxID=1233114 RepID=UPI0022260D14|nr:UbiA family prenyltransferase [Azospirillum fermentarium]MCW2246385.1 4-hydroxybenzoate polyprenyltransferase/phosphoserine phosphatase [Azospirillum fermentarium]